MIFLGLMPIRSNQLHGSGLLHPFAIPNSSIMKTPKTHRAADDLLIGPNRNNQSDQRMRSLRPQVSHGNLRTKASFDSSLSKSKSFNK